MTHFGDFLPVSLIRLQNAEKPLVYTLIPAVALLDRVDELDGVIELDTLLRGAAAGSVGTVCQDLDGHSSRWTGVCDWLLTWHSQRSSRLSSLGLASAGRRSRSGGSRLRQRGAGSTALSALERGRASGQMRLCGLLGSCRGAAGRGRCTGARRGRLLVSSAVGRRLVGRRESRCGEVAGHLTDDTTRGRDGYHVLALIVIVAFDAVPRWKERVETLDQSGMAFKQVRDAVDNPGRVDTGQVSLVISVKEISSDIHLRLELLHYIQKAVVNIWLLDELDLVRQ